MRGLRFVLSLLFGGIVSWLRSLQAFRKGKIQGEAEAAHRSSANVITLAEATKEIRNEVEALPPDELRRRASRWVRGKPKDDAETGQ